MKLYHITAIFKKTLKDMVRNKKQLLFFLMFPVMTYLFFYSIPEDNSIFPIVFLPINILFCSMNIMASVISEEKETGTLRSLIFANIKPFEYFLGNGLFVLLATIISSSLFLPLIKISGINYFYFYLFVSLSSICSMILGATVGIVVKNQMSANGICAPVTVVLGMLPTFGAMNDTFRNLSKVLYTTRFADTVAEITSNVNITVNFEIVLTYMINFIICLVIFAIVYKKKKLDE